MKSLHNTSLTPAQHAIAHFPQDEAASLWCHGLAGSGKTTALVARMLALLNIGVRPDSILVLVADRAQRDIYEQALAACALPISGGVTIATFYGLCQRTVALFWPLAASAAGFSHPEQEPTFLTVESTQFFMSEVTEPLVRESGYFSDITIRRERLLSQLIDNLNKSALAGFPPDEIAARLISGWAGSERRYKTYQQAQDCALRFRAHCLQHNLLDLSLTVELFTKYILPAEEYRRYAHRQFAHLLVDNLEENVPVACEFIDWMRSWCLSTVLAEDEEGSYRVFLGADRREARAVGKRCRTELAMQRLPGSNPDPLTLAARARAAMRLPEITQGLQGSASKAVIAQCAERYWIGMIRWVAGQADLLVQQGCEPGQIAVIAPYVSEVMRFSLEEELRERGIGLFLLRPATPLRDDVVVRAGLTLARLAHPFWRGHNDPVLKQLPVEDLGETLGLALAGLDPVRARLLALSALPNEAATLVDLSAQAGESARQAGAVWQRLGYQLRERYGQLREWIMRYMEGEPQELDIFLTRLFEVLSQPGFGFYQRPDLARSFSRLVESAYKFRLAAAAQHKTPGAESGSEPAARSAMFTAFTLKGLASAEYVLDRPEEADDAVLLAPAFAYLTRGIRSRYQFWCDLRSDGWWNRPNQPLTHPYILSRHWRAGRQWFDADEDQARREVLGRVLMGLAARCSGGIFLALSELGINGEEQSGRLERILQNALITERTAAAAAEGEQS